MVMVDGDDIRWHILVVSHVELDYDMLVVDGDYIRWNFSHAELDSGGKHMAGMGEVEGGLEITLDLPAMKAELTRVQAKCAIRGLAQVHEQS